jgi:REP element-mobilizing transposase RayT
MSHNYIQCRVHIVFSTKGRRSTIPEQLQPRLWQYISGICRNLGVKPIAVGGFDDHCHILVGISATITLSELVQKIKANSSRWLNAEHLRAFQWQDNYCLFSVSASHMDRTIAYIRNQREHHKRRSFDDELTAILKKHGIEMVRAVPSGL